MPVTNNLSSINRLDEHIVIDCAGASRGGAARFLKELQEFLTGVNQPNVQLIGLGKQLTARWLIQRELFAASAARRISLNNAGFVNPRGENITLLRNILQFATDSDFKRLTYSPSRRLRVQTPVVKALARASDTLVVPCTRMSEQVARVAAPLKDKLTVRFHPVTKPRWAGETPKNPNDVLLPVVPSPYKNLVRHIAEFLEASAGLIDQPIRLIVCSTSEHFPGWEAHARIKFIGPQTAEQLDDWWRNSGAIFFPPEFEAFGYPLAEARVYGRNVIAPDSAQSREIAGRSLRAYVKGDRNSLAAAIRTAITCVCAPDPEPFDPSAYFTWLLAGGREEV